MSSILHISDPHFGTELPHVAQALLQLVKLQSPDAIVISGDITQRARRKQFKAAREFIDQLESPVKLIIPGNHDISLFNPLARIFYPYANFQREFGKNLEPVFESSDLLIITLNTTRRYRHIDGELSPSQIKRTAALLKNASTTQLRLVVTHQPICAIRLQDEDNVLKRNAEAVNAWVNAGVDLILGGHIHLPYVCALEDKFNHLPRKAWALQAGTCISSRVRQEAGNSVNLIRYSTNSLNQPDANSRTYTVERWDYQKASNDFEKKQSHELIRS